MSNHPYTFNLKKTEEEDETKDPAYIQGQQNGNGNGGILCGIVDSTLCYLVGMEHHYAIHLWSSYLSTGSIQLVFIF